MNSPVKNDMHLLVVALLDDSYLEDIILGMTSISGAQVTMVDAVSGTQNLSHAIPMFADIVIVNATNKTMESVSARYCWPVCRRRILPLAFWRI